MVYLILAAMVFVILAVTGCLKSQPMPRDMEEAEDWLDRKLEAERMERKPKPVRVTVSVLVITPDRPQDPYMERARKAINQMIGEV